MDWLQGAEHRSALMILEVVLVIGFNPFIAPVKTLMEVIER